MANEVELAHLDLRYESFRLKQAALEERLLASIAQRGIEEPLEGVEVKAVHRSCSTGSSGIAARASCGWRRCPIVSLGPDEAVGILSLLRTSNNRALSILEQAAFIAELKNAARHERGADRRRTLPEQILGQCAPGALRRDERTGAAATLRRGLSGLFLYVPLRQFMRMNGVSREQIEEFVLALSGKGLSVREVEQLAHGCFRGPESFRQEILKGNVALPWSGCGRCPPVPTGAASLSGFCSETWN
jgi:hypothetical protein